MVLVLVGECLCPSPGKCSGWSIRKVEIYSEKKRFIIAILSPPFPRISWKLLYKCLIRYIQFASEERKLGRH